VAALRACEPRSLPSSPAPFSWQKPHRVANIVGPSISLDEVAGGGLGWPGLPAPELLLAALSSRYCPPLGPRRDSLACSRNGEPEQNAVQSNAAKTALNKIL
jgi:hypothetical protein